MNLYWIESVTMLNLSSLNFLTTLKTEKKGRILGFEFLFKFSMASYRVNKTYVVNNMENTESTVEVLPMNPALFTLTLLGYTYTMSFCLIL